MGPPIGWGSTGRRGRGPSQAAPWPFVASPQASKKWSRRLQTSRLSGLMTAIGDSEYSKAPVDRGDPGVDGCGRRLWAMEAPAQGFGVQQRGR